MQYRFARNVGIAIGLDAGFRLSEMLALTWKDYRKREISVSKSLEKERQTVKKTKNEDTRAFRKYRHTSTEW